MVTATLDQLELEITHLSEDDCARMIGRLESLKVSLWMRVFSLSSSKRESSKEELSLLTVPQVAELLSLPKGRVYELVRQGHLPALHVGKYVRVSQTDLTKYIRGSLKPKQFA